MPNEGHSVKTKVPGRYELSISSKLRLVPRAPRAPTQRTASPASPASLAPHQRLAQLDPTLAAIIDRVGPPTLSVEPAPLFHALAHAITYQQLNGKAAASILARWRALVPGKAFPKPAAVLALGEEQLRGAGLSFAKIAAIRDLAAKCVDGSLPTARKLATMSDEDIVAALTGVRGVGTWTVEMFLMFRLGREDVLPVGDFGVRNGFRLAYGLPEMPTPKALAAHGERWRPYRSLASWYLWRAVDLDREDRKQTPEPPPKAGARTKR